MMTTRVLAQRLRVTLQQAAPPARTAVMRAALLAMVLQHRSIESAVEKFDADLRDLVQQYFDGGSLRIGDMREVVSQGIYNAYTEALTQAGIAPADIAPEDFTAMDVLTLQATAFLNDFVKAVRAAKGDVGKEAAIDARIDLWSNTIKAAGTAGLNSAMANEMVEFGGEDGEESCTTCQKYKGVRHRRKWWEEKGLVPGQPGNTNFECRGYRCKHELIPVRR